MSTLSEKALTADPAPLGLSAFAITTFLLSFANLGLIPAASAVVVMPLALFYGGSAQLIAGCFEMRKGNTFGFTALSSYGAFWLFYAGLVLLGSMGIINPPPIALGVALVLWGIFTFYMWIPSMFINLSLALTFSFLWPAFLALGIGAGMNWQIATQVGGALGLGAAFFAGYTGFAVTTNSIVGPGTIPLGRGLKKKTPPPAATEFP
jgi:hypothetical protein